MLSTMRDTRVYLQDGLVKLIRDYYAYNIRIIIWARRLNQIARCPPYSPLQYGLTLPAKHRNLYSYEYVHNYVYVRVYTSIRV